MEDVMNEVTRILDAIIGNLNLIEVKGQTNLAIRFLFYLVFSLAAVNEGTIGLRVRA